MSNLTNSEFNSRMREWDGTWNHDRAFFVVTHDQRGVCQILPRTLWADYNYIARRIGAYELLELCPVG